MPNIFDAISNNDLPTIQNLLANGVDVNAQLNLGVRSTFGFLDTPLGAAIWSNKLDVMKLLIEKGADVNACNKSGKTVLMHSVRHHNLGATRLLLDNGANINAQDDDGHTALTQAIIWGNLDSMQLLLDNGADINICDKDGYTSLIQAVSSNSLNAMELLLEKGVDVNAQDDHGDTALIHSIFYKKSDAVIALIKWGADINIRDNHGRSALMIAETKLDPELINIFKLTLNTDSLLAGKEVNDIDPSQIELFLDILKARAFTRGIDDYEAFIKELNPESNDFIEKITALLRESDKRIDEFESILRGEIEGISTMPASLVKKGIKQAQDDKIEENDFDYRPDPDTLKYYADHPKELEVVGTYLKRLDPISFLTELKNEGNAGALELFATIFTNTDFSKIIMPTSLKGLLETLMPTFSDFDVNSQDSHGQTKLKRAVESNDLEAAKLLIEKGADVNIPDNDRSTALLQAVEDDNLDAIKLLLANSADVNVEDNYGYTPLMTAAIRNHSEAIKLLLANGADINVQNSRGETALMDAALVNDVESIALLLENGADVNIQSNKGNSALMIAETKGNPEIINILKLALNTDSLLAGKEVNDIYPSQEDVTVVDPEDVSIIGEA